MLAVAGGVAAIVVGAGLYLRRRKRLRPRRILVVGSINVDLYFRAKKSTVTIAGKSININEIKGMTLPASSFVGHRAIAPQLSRTGLVSSRRASSPGRQGRQVAGASCGNGSSAESLVLKMEGPFEQKTGGKGANAAAAAGQTCDCEWYGHLGDASVEENRALLADLRQFGQVDTSRCVLLPGCPTGTAYILLFEDNVSAPTATVPGSCLRCPTAVPR